MGKVGRNTLCRCGSGRKFKHCCEGLTPWYKKNLWIGVVIALVVVAAAAIAWDQLSAPSTQDAQGRVWSPEHGHYH